MSSPGRGGGQAASSRKRATLALVKGLEKKRALFALFVVSMAWAACALIFGKGALASPLPPLPGSTAPTAAAPARTSPAASVAPTPGQGLSLERITRGVVTVERDGRLLGAGTVLAGDGRVLTALSVMGASEVADIRYSDGSVVHGKVGHRDKTWDLALLVPQSGKWLEGLSASELDPSATELRGIVAAHPGHPAIVPAQLRGTVEARAKDGSEMPNALDVDIKGVPSFGAPVTDALGGVVGVIVHACKAADSGPCSPLAVAAPVAALRQFLVRTPLSAAVPAPWLGIVGEPDSAGNTHGVRVMAIAPQSPADKGGLKTNPERPKADLIVAVDGQPVDTPERLAELISKHSVGETVKLLVMSGDKFHDVAVTLRSQTP
jgi:serine protease Do